MKISVRYTDGFAIVDVTGNLIGGLENSERFHTVFKSLLSDGKCRIAVNLGETPWADSQGIGMLIGAYTSVTRVEGELVLAAPSQRVRNLLAVTQLNRLFTVVETEEKALSYLRAASATPGVARSLATSSGAADDSGTFRAAARW